MKKINKSILALSVLALALLPITNCASLFKGTSEEVNFSSEPTGVEVYINGSLAGNTPLRLRLESKGTYNIEFRKEGSPTKAFRIGNTIGGTWIVLDVLAGLLPIVIDAATGAWFELDNKNINTIMEEDMNGRERRRF